MTHRCTSCHAQDDFASFLALCSAKHSLVPRCISVVNFNRSICLKQVLDRFPLLDYTDTTLPPQVAMFAHPEGLTCKRQAPLPIFFTIVFTSNEGRRVYASVLTFHDVLQQVGRVTTKWYKSDPSVFHGMLTKSPAIRGVFCCSR